MPRAAFGAETSFRGRTFTKLERDGVIEIMPGSIGLLDPARAEAGIR